MGRTVWEESQNRWEASEPMGSVEVTICGFAARTELRALSARGRRCPRRLGYSVGARAVTQRRFRSLRVVGHYLVDHAPDTMR